MRRSFVSPADPNEGLTRLSRSSKAQIRQMALSAGLELSEELMEELSEAYPPFEDMVRRLPRGADVFDEPALVFAPEALSRRRQEESR